MEKVKLSFGDTIKDSITIGLKNAPSIVGCVVLWILTIWIPWINVGTTIAIWTLPIELSKGKIISPLSIFDGKYRKHFGNVFLTIGLMVPPIIVALFFMIVPAIVLSIAWSLAIFFVIDKGKNATEALSASNEATHGSKWAIFGVMICISIGIFILNWLFGMILDAIDVGFITLVINLAIFVLGFSISTAANASIYRQLQNNV